MPERAHVTSVEALESFRTSLIIYVSKARPILDEVGSDVLRTRLWLQNEQRLHWENQLRRRRKALEQAQQALSSARMSNLPQAIIVEQVAVQRAKRAFEEAEAKLKLVKYWNREYDSRVEPLARQLEKLQTILIHDMPNAAAYLTQAIQTLAAYAEIVSSSGFPTSTPPSGGGPPGGEAESKQPVGTPTLEPNHPGLPKP
jgi:hypothetical protein